VWFGEYLIILYIYTVVDNSTISSPLTPRLVINQCIVLNGLLLQLGMTSCMPRPDSK